MVINFKTDTAIISRTFGGSTKYRIAKLRKLQHNKVKMDMLEIVDLDFATFHISPY